MSAEYHRGVQRQAELLADAIGRLHVQEPHSFFYLGTLRDEVLPQVRALVLLVRLELAYRCVRLPLALLQIRSHLRANHGRDISGQDSTLRKCALRRQ